ncbi:MAG: hypothetical protein ABI687_09890 [Flavitalea sp.]
MRSLVIFFISTIPLVSSSQGVFSNTTSAVLQSVISDYSNRFRNIKGETISNDPQSTDYASKVQIPGSVNAIITKYNSDSKKEIYSWKCLLLESDDFVLVSRRYKELHNQIRNSIVKIEGEKPFIINGAYEIPDEEKKFTTSSFYLLPATGEMKKIKIELTMEFYVTEWKVALLVYDQQQETTLTLK